MKSLFAILLLVAFASGQGVNAGGTSGIGGTSNIQGGGIAVSSITVTPLTQSQNVGQTVGFTAVATLSDGSLQNVTPVASWTSSNVAIAAPVLLTSTENYICNSAGAIQVLASYGNAVGVAQFTCVGVLPPPPTPVSLAVSPLSPSVSVGQSAAMTATETMTDGSSLNVTATVVWTSGTPSVATVGALSSTQAYNCVRGGTSIATATDAAHSLSGTSTITCNAVLTSIVLSPSAPSVVAGNTVQFSATCNYNDGSTQNCSPTWSSSNTTVATISSTGLATSVAAGTSTITGTIGSISGTSVLTVTSPGPPTPTLVSITVTPANKTVNVNSTLGLVATGTYSDNSTANVTALATWGTSNSGIASLQLADAVVGSSYSATIPGTGSTPRTFTTPATTTSGQIDLLDWAAMPLPDRNSFHLSGAALKYFRVDGGLLWWLKGSSGNPWDGELYDAQFIYHWFTENGDSVDQPACIAAGYSSCYVDPFANKTFINPVPLAPRYFTSGSTITIMSPSTLSSSSTLNGYKRTTNCGADNQQTLYLGNIKGVTSGPFTDINFGGSIPNATPYIRIDYYYSGNGAGVYNSRERYWLVQGYGQAQWDVASWNGTTYVVSQTSLNNNKVAGGAPVPNFGCKVPNLPITGSVPPGTTTVSAPQLDLVDSTGAISGTPNTPGTYAFTVQQEDGGGTFHITPETIVVNATNASAHQTINGVANGTATITATVGSVSGNTNVTVQTPAPTLVSIVVTPPNPTQYNGSTVQFVATGHYSDSSTQTLTSQVTWTSGTTTVATITAGGLGKCIANSGSSTITATLGAVSGNTSLACQQATSNTGGNAYCTPSNTWIGATTDGPALLPVNCMYTPVSATPSPGATRGPDSLTSQVQADINAAACGDTILVTAGSVLGGITLPAKACDSAHWITIKSTGVSNGSFPAEGTRMTPCWTGIASMPGRPAYTCPSPTVLTFTLTASLGGNAIVGSGDHYRIIGAYITRNKAHGLVFFLVDLPGTTSPFPNNIIFDRCWFDGVEGNGTFPQTSTTSTETQRGINLRQSNHIAVIDSYFSNFYCDSGLTPCDSQSIGGGFGSVANSGWGVYKFVNNHIEAAAEGILLGGAGGPPLTPPGCTITVNCNIDVPTDLEIRQNYFFKPAFWNGNTTTVAGAGWPIEKNGFEMKTGNRALFEGDVIENTWYQAQVGYAWSTAPKNQSGGNPLQGVCPTCLTNNFTYRFNYAYNVAYGIGLYQSKDSGCNGPPTCDAQGANGISEHDNVIGDNLNMGSLSQQNSGDQMEIFVATDQSGTGVLDQINNVNISHNTFVKGIRSVTIFGGANNEMHNWTVQNNIWSYANFGFMSFGAICDQGSGITNNAFAILNNCVNPYTWNFNAVFNWLTANGGVLGNKWPTDGHGAGNFFFSGVTSVGFTNYGTGDSGFNPQNYQLAASSSLHNAGSDGKDIGADIVTLLQKIAGVRQ